MFGGGGGDTLSRARGYKVTPPVTWKAENKREADQAYVTPAGSVATLTSSCQRDSTAPLDALTRHLLMGARKAKFKSKETMTVDGVDGMLSTVTAKYDGVAFNMVLFVLPKDGCIFDFTLLNPKPIAASDVDAFKTFVNSFQYGKN